MLARRPWLTAIAVWALWAAAIVLFLAVMSSLDAWDDPLHWQRHGGPLWPLFTWDYGWYETIATYGYPHVAGTVYAFFPLWALLLRASGGIPDWAWAFGLVLVSTALAFIGVAIGDGRSGWRAAGALACWPGSFLLLLAYPDALALAAGAWAAAFALRGRPLLAAAAGAVAAAARPNGVLLAIPLALATRSGPGGRALAAAGPVAAAAAVQIFFWRRSGDWQVFFRAQSQPVWQRNGPSRLAKWPSHVASAFESHALLLVVAAIVAVAVVGLVYRRAGAFAAVAAVYVFVVCALLLGAQQASTRIESGLAAVAFAALVLAWRRGRAMLPWALFATAVLAASFLSGSVTSFGRQALFAFPLFWAVGDGPRTLRHPLLVAGAVAANVAYALTVVKYTP